MIKFIVKQKQRKSFQKIKIRLNKSPNNITFINNQNTIKIKNV